MAEQQAQSARQITEERVAAALRENLRKRKAQKQAQEQNKEK